MDNIKKYCIHAQCEYLTIKSLAAFLNISESIVRSRIKGNPKKSGVKVISEKDISDIPYDCIEKVRGGFLKITNEYGNVSTIRFKQTSIVSINKMDDVLALLEGEEELDRNTKMHMLETKFTDIHDQVLHFVTELGYEISLCVPVWKSTIDIYLPEIKLAIMFIDKGQTGRRMANIKNIIEEKLSCNLICINKDAEIGQAIAQISSFIPAKQEAAEKGYEDDSELINIENFILADTDILMNDFNCSAAAIINSLKNKEYDSVPIILNTDNALKDYSNLEALRTYIIDNAVGYVVPGTARFDGTYITANVLISKEYSHKNRFDNWLIDFDRNNENNLKYIICEVFGGD